MGVTNDGKFLKNATANPANNKDTFLLSIPNVQYDTAVSVFIKDATGCTSEDTIQVFLKSNPIAKLPPDPRICSYDSINIVPNLDSAYWVDPIKGDTLVQGDTLFKEWYYNGMLFDTQDSVTINKRGTYVIRVVDSLNCTDTDTLYLNVNDTVKALPEMIQPYALPTPSCSKLAELILRATLTLDSTSGRISRHLT